MTFAATGCLSVGDVGEAIGPLTTLSNLDTLSIRAAGELRVRPDGPIFSARARVEERPAFLAATFTDHRLHSVELILLDGPGGGGMADQDLLKLEHERWLTHLGVHLTPMPLMLDGVPILPAHIGTLHPRHAVAVWGEVVSLIDPRNGGASVLVRYRP